MGGYTGEELAKPTNRGMMAQSNGVAGLESNRTWKGEASPFRNPGIGNVQLPELSFGDGSFIDAYNEKRKKQDSKESVRGMFKKELGE